MRTEKAKDFPFAFSVAAVPLKKSALLRSIQATLYGENVKFSGVPALEHD